MDPLTAQFDALRARLRSLSVLTGLAWTFSITLLLVLAACAADWLFHLDSVAARRTAVWMIASAGVGCLLSLVVRPLWRRYSDVDLALQIERLQPGWQQALSSAAQFSGDDFRPETGASALQRALIERIGPRLARLDPASLLNSRLLLAPAALAVLACLLTAALIAADQERASLALQRLVQPGSAPPWPRQHTLVLLSEQGEPLDADGAARLAPAGEPLRLYVADAGGSLPDDVLLHVQDRQGSIHTEPLRRAAYPITDQGEQACLAVVPQLGDRIWIRATGGDDDRMPWHLVSFAPRPAVQSFNIELTPPDYTGRPAESAPADGTPIEALVGTRVRLEMEANTPLQQVRFRRDNRPAQTLQLDRDARRAAVEFELTDAGRFACWFELADHNGLSSRDLQRIELRGIADGEPTVSIETPASDLTVTPQARLPVSVVARDDLRLMDVRLVLSNPPGSAGELSYPFLLPDGSLTEAALDTELSIADMDLPPGRVVQMRSEATDAYDLGQPHIARSQPRVLTVVTPAEKLQELQARQTGIAQSLERAHGLQNGAWQQTRELQLQWKATRSLSNEDFDVLKRVVGNQDRIASELLDERRGVAARVSGILQELDWNQLDDAATSERLESVRRQLTHLEGEVFASLKQSLADARKALSSESLDDRETVVDAAFSSALVTHESAVTSLAMLLALFKEWQLQFDLNRELAAIQDAQQQLNQETLAVGRDTVGRASDGLTPQQRADLARLASRQQDAARQVDQLQARLEELMSEEDQQELSTAEDVAGALDVLQNAALAGDMRQAANQIQQNRVSDAVNVQQRILQTLETLDSAIRGIGASDPETLLKQVEEAQAETESLRQRQADALDKSQSLSDPSSADADALQELRKQQQELAADAADWAQRLMRQQLGDAAATAARASRSVEDAAGQLEDEVTPSAMDAQQEALDDLLQTERELAQMREQLEVTRMFAEMSRFASLVETLAARQQHLLDETIRLDAAQQERGSLNRAQLRTLQQMADAQSQLGGDIEPATASIADAPVLSAALLEVQGLMSQAAEQLAERAVGEPTQQLQRAAGRRLSEIRQLIGDTGSTSAPSSAASSSTEREAGSPAWSSLVQIKLLLQMQEEIVEQTRTLRLRRQNGDTLTEAEQAELERLALRQAALAELAVETFAGPQQAAPANDPSDAEEVAP